MGIILHDCVGVLIGKYIPIIPSALGKMQIAGISVPIAILIWVIIYPMMIKVDFQSIKSLPVLTHLYKAYCQ